MFMLENRENIFYLSVGIAVLLFELSVPSGLYVCIALPLTLIIVSIGFWTFREENSNN